MANKKFLFGMLILLLVFGITLIGCPTEPHDCCPTEPDEPAPIVPAPIVPTPIIPTPTVPTYTVWTDTVSYSEYYDIFGTLNEGTYVRTEITNSVFERLSFPNERKHQWTEDQIYDWFIVIGLGTIYAIEEKAWITTIGHGFLAIRRSMDSSFVYIILK